VTLGYSVYRQRRDDGDHNSAQGYLLGVERRLSDATRVRAALSQHVRFPTIRQLYDADSGVAALEHETARNKEIGLSHRFGADTQVALTLFRNDVADYIEKDEVSGLFANFDHYRFTGVEVDAQTRVSTTLRLRGSYSYTESENLSSGAEVKELQYRPDHKVVLEALLDMGAGWRGQLSGTALNDQVHYSRSSPKQKAPVRNLFDDLYETSYGLPQPGRFLYVGVEYGI